MIVRPADTWTHYDYEQCFVWWNKKATLISHLPHHSTSHTLASQVPTAKSHSHTKQITSTCSHAYQGSAFALWTKTTAIAFVFFFCFVHLLQSKSLLSTKGPSWEKTPLCFFAIIESDLQVLVCAKIFIFRWCKRWRNICMMGGPEVGSYGYTKIPGHCHEKRLQ
jgi:hypothetical protein